MKEAHLNWEAALAVAESPETPDAAVEAHLGTCRTCARLVSDARWLLGAIAQARLPQPAADLVDKTLDLLRPWMVESARPEGREAVRKLLATLIRRFTGRLSEVRAGLVADSLVPSSALRGTEEASPRMLLYATDEYSIALSLRTSRAGELQGISGTVTPVRGGELPAGGLACLESGPWRLDAPLSEFGEFFLEEIQTEARELNILLGDAMIRLRLPSPGTS